LPMVDNREETRSRDALRGHFELFRHLNTVSILVLVIVLVLYRDLYLNPALALLSLAMFGVAALTSFYGMFLAMRRTLSPEPPKLPGALLRGLLYVAVLASCCAVLCLVVSVAIAGVT
jgi:hypothetical protein